MPRPTKRSKSVILVFCEGESEQGGELDEGVAISGRQLRFCRPA